MTSHSTVTPAAARRIAAALAASALALGLLAGPASATHTFGTLDCGAAGVYEVEAASIEPLAVKFDTPAPWSGLLLLEDTTRVFKAFSVVTARWSVYMPAAEQYPGDLEHCTLSSSGLNFTSPWVLAGVFRP
jgi:hypothetical protein